MSPSFACAPVLLLSFALAPSVPAQDQGLPFQRPEFRGGRGDRPARSIVHVTYDAQLERVTSVRRSSAGELGVGSPPCFDNSEITVPDDPGYIVANSGEDLLAWGSKNCPGASRLRNFTIAYRSEAVDVSQGGPGAVFSLALYSGTTGFGHPGTEIFRRVFTGMPSDGAPPSPTVQYLTGEPTVFFTVDFGTEPLPLADGNFGWAFLQMDGDTGPCVVQTPKPLLGTADALDIYAPGPARTANYLGTFNYGGCNNYPFRCANMYIQLDEIANNEVALTTVQNGSGANPVLLQEVFPAQIGHVWAVRVNASVPSVHPPPYTILFICAAAFGPASSPYGEVLVDPGQKMLPPLPGEAGYSFAIPPDTSLIGFVVYTQAAVLPPALPAVTLTNALRVRVGF